MLFSFCLLSQLGSILKEFATTGANSFKSYTSFERIRKQTIVITAVPSKKWWRNIGRAHKLCN